jgi:tetrapyrrole methylase family protein / MazG family protein
VSGKVLVVGLGPAGPELLTVAAREALARVPRRYLRTARHPAAAAVADATTFDDRYESSATLDEVYRGIVDDLAAAAEAHGEVLYAVPGSPTVAERTVDLLRQDRRVEVEVLPAVSFVDLAWERLGIDPLAAGVRLVDGHDFGVAAAGVTSPLLVGQVDHSSVLSDIKLCVEDPGDLTVTVLQRLGLADEAVFDVAWDELDRGVRADHLTTLWIPALAEPVAAELQRFADLVRRLRRDCPWDREQTHQSLTRHLVEESYEVLDAIDLLGEDEGAGYAALEEELGDLLFQVVFHATLGAEEGRFTLADVARGIHDKLVARHPHVFGDVAAETADHVIANWEAAKVAEKGRESVFDGIPRGLPALLYALKVMKKAEATGLVEQWPLPDGDDVGAELLAVVSAARAGGVDPEEALRRSTTAWVERLRAAESRG